MGPQERWTLESLDTLRQSDAVGATPRSPQRRANRSGAGSAAAFGGAGATVRLSRLDATDSSAVRDRIHAAAARAAEEGVGGGGHPLTYA